MILRDNDSLENQLTREVLDSLNEYEVDAVQYVYSKGRITTKEFADITGRSTKTASGVLKNLVGRGILKWHGTNSRDPSQYYALR